MVTVYTKPSCVQCDATKRMMDKLKIEYYLRKTKEIYISNWYITSAVIFLPIIAVVSYLPFWQKGIGETILQGFYMHQAVGLWFMFFCLGLLYYFLPQQLNKPIFSYSLGVLAFWTQILFYTLIGTHLQPTPIEDISAASSSSSRVL